MRTCLIVIGVIASVLIVLIIILLIVGISAVKPLLALQARGNHFFTASVTAMAKDWNPQTLMNLANPEFKAQLSKNEKAARLFAAYKMLGHLQHLDKPVGLVFSGLSTQYGNRTTGQFTDTGHFSNGRARIRMGIILNHKQWQIYAFSMQSSVFLPPAPKSISGPTTAPKTPPKLAASTAASDPAQ